MRANLANALATPAAGAATTIMLDESMPTAEGTNTRMGNVVNALIPRIRALPPSAAVGLWTFDGVEGGSQVTAGPLADPVDGRPRSEALTDDARRAVIDVGRRGIVYHAPARLQRGAGEFPCGSAQFGPGDYGGAAY